MTKVLITAKLTGSNAPNLFFDSVLANPESLIPGYLENFLRVRCLDTARSNARRRTLPWGSPHRTPASTDAQSTTSNENTGNEPIPSPQGESRPDAQNRTSLRRPSAYPRFWRSRERCIAFSKTFYSTWNWPEKTPSTATSSTMFTDACPTRPLRGGCRCAGHFQSRISWIASEGAASNRQPHQMLVRILKGRSADFGLGGARIQSCRVIEGVIAKGCLAAKGDPAKSLPQAFAVLAFF